MASITATKPQARSKSHGKGKTPPRKPAKAKAAAVNRKATPTPLNKATRPTPEAARDKTAANGKAAPPKAAARQAPTAKIIAPPGKIKVAKNAKLTARKKSARRPPSQPLPKPGGKTEGTEAVHRSGSNGRDGKKMDTLDEPTLKAATNGTSARNGDGAATAQQSEIVLQPTYRPSEGEPFMNAKHRTYFRHKLLKWKQDIVAQNMETLKGLHDDSTQQADPADRATAETDRALELRARDRQRKLMGKIDSALARIEEGSYGYCEETGEPISLKRLDARPIATLSLEAQERRERRERIFRED